MDESRVWIRKRATKRGTTYHLRWVCPQERRWKSRKVGADRRRAEREAALLEKQLAEGTYQSVTRTSWDEFVSDHVAKIPGKSNRVETSQTLREFGEILSPPGPHKVTFSMVERYVAELRSRKKAVATINKKLRYLRSAFRSAIKRGMAGRNPMEGWVWERENEPTPRVVTDDEETAILDAAERLYGLRWYAFVYIALQTGARRGELLGLTWDRVDLETGSVRFTHTKGKRDRSVPLNDDALAVLRRVQAMTLQAGGPFVGMANNVNRVWHRIRRNAGVDDVTLHDLRRTCATRLFNGGTPPKTVQEILGYANITTTLRHYTEVTETDKREAVARLRKQA